jgi:hypothetical protein
MLAGHANDVRVVERVDVASVAARLFADVDAARLDFVEPALWLLGGRGLDAGYDRNTQDRPPYHYCLIPRLPLHRSVMIAIAQVGHMELLMSGKCKKRTKCSAKELAKTVRQGERSPCSVDVMKLAHTLREADERAGLGNLNRTISGVSA